ncbi:hypothetical protein EVAR_6259_1 [Eumeta japonica]|uniref:Uncharacterized protein n=1 Tax=Eumeta variegata TaxID=151549 RepID=A0A4C1T986_EUMVA|nr:hypothetical protein EVAR_6259_1 [Eumeta japonica]
MLLPLTPSILVSGPHREMAVDVPDSFVARNKTPPRYPPPRPPQVSSPSACSPPPSITQDYSASQSSNSSSSSGSKKSKGSSETAKCGDLFSERSGSAASNTTQTLSDHKIQLIVPGEDHLDCRERVAYWAGTDSVLIREALYAAYTLPPGFDSRPVLLGREVAVDVPDSFVQTAKRAPKYPGTVDRKSVAYHKISATFDFEPPGNQRWPETLTRLSVPIRASCPALRHPVLGRHSRTFSSPAVTSPTSDIPCRLSLQLAHFAVNGTTKPVVTGAPAVPPRDSVRDAPPRPPAHEAKDQLDSIKKYQVSGRSSHNYSPA